MYKTAIGVKPPDSVLIYHRVDSASSSSRPMTRSSRSRSSQKSKNKEEINTMQVNSLHLPVGEDPTHSQWPNETGAIPRSTIHIEDDAGGPEPFAFDHARQVDHGFFFDSDDDGFSQLSDPIRIDGKPAAAAIDIRKGDRGAELAAAGAADDLSSVLDDDDDDDDDDEVYYDAINSPDWDGSIDDDRPVIVSDPSRDMILNHQDTNKLSGNEKTDPEESKPWDHNEIIPAEEPMIEVLAKSNEYIHALSSTDHGMLRLLDVCEFIGAPLYTFDLLIKVMREEMNSGFKPVRCCSREAFVNKLKKQYRIGCKPEQVPVALEGDALPSLEYTRSHRELAYVIRYGFWDQLLDLINDTPLFGNLANLKGCVNLQRAVDGDGTVTHSVTEESFKPYVSSGGFDEIHDGDWYKETCQQISDYMESIGSTEAWICLAIIGYVDKTGTDAYQRYGVEPFLFTLAILNRMARGRDNAWRVLGFVPDLDLKSSSSKKRYRNTKLGKGRSVRQYHACLSKILDSFSSSQQMNVRRTAYIRIGDKVKRVRVFTPLAFVIGDGKSNDTLCGRYGGHKTERMSRSCMVSYEDSNNPYHECKLMPSAQFEEQSEIVLKIQQKLPIDTNDAIFNMSQTEKKKAEKEALEQLQITSTHVHANAFSGIWFGANERGIVGATPVDCMHAFLHGVLRYAINVYIGQLQPKEMAVIDNTVDDVLRPLRSSMRHLYPRWNFSRGVTNLKLITADEWGGVAFSLLLVHLTAKGREAMEKAFRRLHPEFDYDQTWTDEDVRPEKPVSYSETVSGEYFDVSARLEDHARKKGAHEFKQSDEHDDADSKDDSGSDNDSLNEIDEDPEEEDAPASPSNTKDPPAAAKTTKNSEEGPKPCCQPSEFVMILEWLLCFQAWYQKGAPYTGWENSSDEFRSDALAAVRRLLEELARRLPRDKNGWRIQKYHDLLHLADEMRKYGSAMNFDAGVGERQLQSKGKTPAGTAHKCGSDDFLSQISERLYVSAILRTASRHAPNFISLVNPDNFDIITSDDNGAVSSSYDGRASYIVFVKEEAVSAWDAERIPRKTAKKSTPKKSSVVHETTGSVGATANDVDFSGDREREEEKRQDCETQNGSGQEGVAVNMGDTDERPKKKPRKTRSDKKKKKKKDKRKHNEKEKAKSWNGDYRWLSTKTTKRHVEVHPLILTWFRQCYRETRKRIRNNEDPESAHLIPQQKQFECYTSYKKDGVTYRAHPNFRSEGEWYDWVMVRCDEDPKNEAAKNREQLHEEGLYPCKILAFFDAVGVNGQKGIHALVHRGNYPKKVYPSDKSVLIQTWAKEYSLNNDRKERKPKLRLVGVDSFVSPVLVVEETPGLVESIQARKYKEQLVFVVSDRDSFWSSKFTQFRNRRPKTDAEMEQTDESAEEG
jgi:hypothetical protein